MADAAEAGRLRFAPGGRAVVHPHCHKRAVFGPDDTLRALGCVPGLELTVLDAGCCGMSGVFGYRKERYELSVQVAERALLPALRAAGADDAVLATGTSCRSQIGDCRPRGAASAGASRRAAPDVSPPRGRRAAGGPLRSGQAGAPHSRWHIPAGAHRMYSDRIGPRVCGGGPAVGDNK